MDTLLLPNASLTESFIKFMAFLQPALPMRQNPNIISQIWKLWVFSTSTLPYCTHWRGHSNWCTGRNFTTISMMWNHIYFADKKFDFWECQGFENLHHIWSETSWDDSNGVPPNRPVERDWSCNQLLQAVLLWSGGDCQPNRQTPFTQDLSIIFFSAMLVLTTMFINVSNNLPKTSYVKVKM